MIEGTDTISLSDDDTIVLRDDYFTAMHDPYDISMNVTLPTALSTGYSYKGSLTTATLSVGAPGSVLSTASGGMIWSGSASAAGNPLTIYPGNTTPGGLKVSGNAEFGGEVTIKGVKLDERLDAIEERLGILRPNNDLEGKWEKLKALGEEYRRLEKEILEGESIWDTLKR